MKHKKFIQHMGVVTVAGLIEVAAFGQTLSPYQDNARPFGMDIVNPVMKAGSDAKSADFQQNVMPTLLEAVNLNLSEGQSVAGTDLIGLNSNQLSLTNDSSARVYFLGEGAGYHNTLGFSVMEDGTGISAVDSVTENGQLIFPDASSYNYENIRTRNAPLAIGDFVDLGEFESGDTLNFFLGANAANGNDQIWMAGPENNDDGIEHMVSFAMAIEDTPYLLMGFEDLYGGGDEDYNDLVFAVDIGVENVQALVIAATPLPPAVWIGLVLVGYLYYRQRKINVQEVAS